MKTFGALILEARRAKGLSQKDLAAKVKKEDGQAISAQYLIPHLAEIMPPEIRTSGFSLAFSLATALFGGFTPLISTYLIHRTGNRASPAFWLSFAAMCGLVAVLADRRMALTEPGKSKETLEISEKHGAVS